MKKLVALADNYRHRQDNQHAEFYYRKALDNITEIESKLMWNVYRKMMRMDKSIDRLSRLFHRTIYKI